MKKASKFYRENKSIVDARYKIFKSKVNMTYKEMVAWKKDPCSRAASIKIDEVINRVTRLIKKPKVTWTEKDFIDSAKVISYISRATKIKDSLKPAATKIGCLKGKNFYALRNWAYDRNKEKNKKGLFVRKNPSDFNLLKNLKIEKRDPKTDTIYYFIWLGDKEIGQASFYKPEQIIDWVEVLPQYRRKGVATLLYDFIEKDLKIKLKPANDLLLDSKMFWRNRKSKTKKSR